MKKVLTTLDKFHKTRTGHLAFGIVELAIAYGFASLAINSGAWWQWLLTLVFLVGALRNLVKLAISLSRVTKH